MDVLTDQPGMQFYSGNFMKGEQTLKSGAKDAYRTAFCLETQHFPDSPNRPEFPSTVLEPGEGFRSTTLYRFRTAASR
jgi:aldose 1-epimerase